MQNQAYTHQRLKDYALWYYFRYYPSNNRLIQKLKEKGEDKDALNVFKEIKHLLQEEEIIKSKIDNYIFRNKNYRYIRQKMREKLFDQTKVEKHLETYILQGDSLLDHDFLRKKIENYIQKGKSLHYIQTKLGETPKDREILSQILATDYQDAELISLKISYEKLHGKYSREKIIQKLLSQGFPYHTISQIL